MSTSNHPSKRGIKHLIPHLTGLPLTIYSLAYCLKSNYLLERFELSVHENNIIFEFKVSLLAKIASWISFLFLFNILSVIGSRVFSNAANPLKDQKNDLVNLANKILNNSVEQFLLFFPLLANWVLNSSKTQNDLEQALTLCIFWIIGRVLFSVTYFFGYLLEFPLLRVYGFAPTLFPSLVLVLRYLGVNLI